MSGNPTNQALRAIASSGVQAGSTSKAEIVGKLPQNGGISMNIWEDLQALRFVLSMFRCSVWKKAIAAKWYFQARWAGQPAKEIVDVFMGPNGTETVN
jgi:hypothetical protein